MPTGGQGAIAGAAQGMQAPRGPGTAQDLSTAVAALVGGVMEERRRQEEQAFREAQLDLQERQVEVQERQADQQARRLDLQEDQFQFQQDVITPLEERRVEVTEGDLDFRREQREQIEQQRREMGRAARHLLTDRYGWSPEHVKRLDDSLAEFYVQHEAERQMNLAMGQLQITSDQIGAVQTIVAENRQALRDAERNLRNQEAHFQNFTEDPRVRADAFEMEQEGWDRDEAFFQLYQQRSESGAQALLDARQRYNHLEQELDQGLEQLRSFLGQTGQSFFGGVSLEQPPPERDEDTGQLGPQEWSYDNLPVNQQADAYATVSYMIENRPREAMAQMGRWLDKGIPVQDILGSKGLTVEQFAESVGEAEGAAGEMQGGELSPEFQVGEVRAGGRGMGATPGRREEAQRAQAVEVLEREAQRLVQEAPQEGGGGRALELAREAVEQVGLSREEVLAAFEGTPFHSFLADRLPTRVRRR